MLLAVQAAKALNPARPARMVSQRMAANVSAMEHSKMAYAPAALAASSSLLIGPAKRATYLHLDVASATI